MLELPVQLAELPRIEQRLHVRRQGICIARVSLGHLLSGKSQATVLRWG